MPTTPTVFPARLSAGTTLKVTRTFTDYPANDGWTATLYVAGESLMAPVAATANGSAFDFTVSSTATSDLAPGDYAYKVLVAKAGEVYVAEDAVITVDPNIISARAGDLLTLAQKALPIVQAAILGRLTADQQSFSIAGRAVVKIPIKELYELRTRFENEIAAARAKRRGTFGRTIRTTFTPLETEA